MNKKIFCKIICVCITLLLTFGSVGSMISSAAPASRGSYDNPNYETKGIYNDKGELVQGVNYTPTLSYGWWPSFISNSYWSESALRMDFENIKRLGFNSLRIFGAFDNGMVNANNFDVTLDIYMEKYERLFEIMREYELTADVIMLPQDGYKTDYKAEGSGISKLIEAFVKRFDSKYDDVIVLWEIANEPDISNAWATIEEATQQFLTDENWKNNTAPYLEWCADYMRKLGVKNPISIGSMNTARASAWDTKTFDVANIHNYFTTTEWFDDFNSGIWALDMQVLGECRPTVLSEIGMPAGMCSPNSDVMQYCVENDIAYYVWGYAWISNEGYMQGLVDNTGKLRSATMPYYTFQTYSNRAPLAVAQYDTTPGGRDTVSDRLWDLDYSLLKGNGDINDLFSATEGLYDWAKGFIPYWMPDFREAVYQAEGETLKERLYYIIEQTSNAVMPYIRTYGSYTGDNALGGDVKIKYLEDDTKYMGMEGAYSQGRARFAFGMGKNGSDAILMQQTNKLIMNNELKDNAAYSIEVSLKIADNSNAGLGIACKDDTMEGNNPGIYIDVTQGETKDFADKAVTGATQAPYTISVSATYTSGINGKIASFSYDPSLIDEDGWLDLKVAYSGIGSAVNPLTGIITSNGTEIGRFEVKYGIDNTCVNTCLTSGYMNAANYFDDLIVKNETTGKVLFSDSFETGKFDYDYLTYAPYNSNSTNDDVLDKLALYLSKVGSSTTMLSTPKDVEAFICDSLLVMKWSYTGKGESGFEIQRSLDGENWERYWRCMPDSEYAIIPLYDDSAADYTYRVGPINSKNTATRICEPVTATTGKGQKGDKLATITDKSGKTHNVIVIGNGVFLDTYGSDCNDSSVPADAFCARFLKKTTSVDTRITNPKAPSAQKAPTSTPLQVEGIGATVYWVIIAVASALILGAAGLFGIKFIKNKKKG